MTLKINQDYKYKGEDWWKWRIWVEGPDEELDKIDYVVYRLHSTFPNPVRTVGDRKSKFELATAGWGEFRIYAKVAFKTGDILNLDHDLVLKKPDPKLVIKWANDHKAEDPWDMGPRNWERCLFDLGYPGGIKHELVLENGKLKYQ